MQKTIKERTKHESNLQETSSKVLSATVPVVRCQSSIHSTDGTKRTQGNYNNHFGKNFRYPTRKSTIFSLHNGLVNITKKVYTWLSPFLCFVFFFKTKEADGRDKCTPWQLSTVFAFRAPKNFRVCVRLLGSKSPTLPRGGPRGKRLPAGQCRHRRQPRTMALSKGAEEGDGLPPRRRLPQ